MWWDAMIGDTRTLSNTRPLICEAGRWYGLCALRPEYQYSRLTRPALERIEAGEALRDFLIDWVHFPHSSAMAQYTGYVLADLLPVEGSTGWAAKLPEPEKVALARWLRSPAVLALLRAVDRILDQASTGAGVHFGVYEINEHTCYSVLERWLSERLHEVASAADWLARLRRLRTKGLSGLELEWSHLYAALQMRGFDRLDGAAVRDLLRMDSLTVAICRCIVPEPANDAGGSAPTHWKLPRDLAFIGQDDFLTSVFARQARLLPIEQDNDCWELYDEWLMCVPHDARYVESQHFLHLPNMLAHVRCGIRRSTQGKRFLLIDEMQAAWPTQRRDRDIDDIEPTPYQSAWVDLACKLALWVAANEWDVSIVAWINGALADKLHLESKPTGMQFVYDELIPRAMTRVCRGTIARRSTVTMNVHDPGWQLRTVGGPGHYRLFKDKVAGEVLNAREMDALARVQACAPVREYTVEAVQLSREARNMLVSEGIPWFGPLKSPILR